jgi:urea transporter
MEVVNGILLGMLMGATYALDFRCLLMTLAGGLLIVIISAIITDTISRYWKLPLLGLPYALVAYMLLPVGAILALSPAPHYLEYLSLPYLNWLCPLGAIYFNGTSVGALLVLIGFAVSSRCLALIAVINCAITWIFLRCCDLSPHSTLFLIAQMNGVLTACVIGGLYAVPSLRACFVSFGAALFACTVTLSMTRLLWSFGLPPLATPFVITTYGLLLALNYKRGNFWANFWLSVPQLPERSIEQVELAHARGVDARSIALRLPLDGEWEIYQGIGGKHTHQGAWYYALDFFKTSLGKSFRGDGDQLTDYYCFAEDVISPVYGKVVQVLDGIADNRPGEVNLVSNWGNYILIAMDTGGFVLLAHLKAHSIIVEIDTRINPGEKLAAVGNSGRSPQPHLHMHVQDVQEMGCHTIPFHLTGVMFKQQTSETYSLSTCPIEGAVLSMPKRNAALKRALSLNVGSRFYFAVEGLSSHVTKYWLEVSLDIYGQFWLTSDAGARVAFISTEEVIAFYNRSGPKDVILDALILSLGLTPLVEGNITWRDVTPKRILRLAFFSRLKQSILHPFSACIPSEYSRYWQPSKRLWIQHGSHHSGKARLESSASFCESEGLISFSVMRSGKMLLHATVQGHGLKGDRGIPESSAEFLLAS